MRLRLLLVVLAALALLVPGCSSKPALVGTWTGPVKAGTVTIELEFDFKSDGTLAAKQSLMGQSSIQRGTYKEEEKSFTFTPTSMESAAIPKELLQEMNKALAKDKKVVTFTLVWKDADTINITQQGAPKPFDVPIELKRKK